MADNEKKVTVATEKDSKPQKVKEDKPSLGSRIKNWLKAYKSEFKKIVWAGPKLVLNNTILVLVVAIVGSAVIGLLDYLFSIGIVGLGRLI